MWRNSNLEQLKTYGDKVLIGQYDGYPLYQSVFTFRHINLPNNVDTLITAYFINQENIVDLSIIIKCTTGTVCNSIFDSYIEGSSLHIIQRFTGSQFSQDATIIAIVKYWDN